MGLRIQGAHAPTRAPCAPSLWHGVQFVREGRYKGGVFRFIVVFPAGYPGDDMRPLITFVDKPFCTTVDPQVR